MTEISHCARDLSLAIAIPYVEVDHQGKYYNSAALFDRTGSLVLNYRKIHLWSSYEQDVFTPGGLEDLKVVTLDGNYKVGIQICFDIEFPEPARVLALKGAELLIVPTALGAGPADSLTPRCFIPTRAQENHVFIAYSNFPYEAKKEGQQKGFLEYCGQSAIVGPDGADLQRAAETGEALLFASFKPEQYKRNFERNPYLKERRPDLYGLLSKL